MKAAQRATGTLGENRVLTSRQAGCFVFSLFGHKVSHVVSNNKVK